VHHRLHPVLEHRLGTRRRRGSFWSGRPLLRHRGRDGRREERGENERREELDRPESARVGLHSSMLASAPTMAATDTLLKIGLAQIDGRLGDVEANAERLLDWIARARDAGVDLLVFPELSLTGYRLLHLTPRVALPLGSPLLARLAEAAGPMRVVAGFVEEGERGVLHNSAVLLAGGEAVHVHRKLYLPTYGIFQEERFFGAGRRLETVSLPWGTAGLLICEDLWHPELARRLAVAGPKLLIVVSAAPGRVGTGALPESQESWETLTRATALLNTCWVV